MATAIGLVAAGNRTARGQQLVDGGTKLMEEHFDPPLPPPQVTGPQGSILLATF